LLNILDKLICKFRMPFDYFCNEIQSETYDFQTTKAIF
jgi:hypothetical protein